MDWYLYAFDASDIARFMRRIFFTGDKGFDISPDLARDLFFTILTFGFGWLFSLKALLGKRRARLIEEVILSQRELVKRAYPELHGEQWREGGDRRAWMLDPFIGRIDFLIASMREDKIIKSKQETLLDHYTKTKREFTEKWSTTLRRGAGYHEAYTITYRAMRAALKELGFDDWKRLNGLMPKDAMFDAPPAAVAVAAAE
ncbi:MAG TPA: hypothetical protein VGO52_11970 [Hyphomonadaceae bacterium]|nr:hypothetical protein [Hyphomonadaceae bacterium]